MIELQKMTRAQFEQFREIAFTHLAQERISAEKIHHSQIDTLKRHASSILTSDLFENPTHYFYTIIEPKSTHGIGHLWFKAILDDPAPHAYLYDIYVQHESRGKGFGKEAMVQFEHLVNKLKLSRIRLRVFHINKHANALYKSLDFLPLSHTLEKTLY